MNDTIPESREGVIKSDKIIRGGKPFENVGGSIKLKKPQGRPPTKKNKSKILYWIGVIISTISVYFWLVIGIIGALSGYYIGNTWGAVFFGAAIGMSIGFILSDRF